MTNYILGDDGEVIPCDNTLTWAAWYESVAGRNARALKRTEISANVYVSTVFLSIVHGYSGNLPVLWETLIFGGPHDGDGEQYTSRDAAATGHELWVLVAKGETTPEAIREMEHALS